MKQTSLILILPILLFSFGCSQKAGKSEAKFKIGLAALTDMGSVSGGGAILWGRSDKGDMFGSVINPTSGFELSLPNGQWTFWSVAWQGDGSGTGLTGVTRCAKSSAALAGTDVQVSLNLSNANCDLQDFTPSVSVSGGMKQFPNISHVECQKLSDHNGLWCGRAGVSGKAVSRRLSLQSFIKPANGTLQILPNRLVGSCKTAGSSFVSERIPVGNGVLPLLTTLQSFYSSANCDESDPKGFKNSQYEFGLLGTAKLDTIKFVNEGSCNPTNFTQTACNLYQGVYSSTCTLPTDATFEISQSACLASGGSYNVGAQKNLQLITTIPDAELCSGPRVLSSVSSPHPFSSGNGTSFSPYTICKEYQLNAIADNYTSKTVYLAADLDMNKTSIVGDGSQPVPSCLQNGGENFIPIGGLFDGSCNETSSAASSNIVFDGGGHTISNIRVHAKTSYIGFIRQGGSVRNLNLVNAEFEGEDYVGAITGDTSMSIANVSINGGKIRGRSFVGGVAGKFGSSVDKLDTVRAKKMVIKSDQGGTIYVGGLVGFTDSPSLYIYKSSFEGMISHQSSGEYVGGFLGKGSSGVNIYIDDSFTNGVLMASGTANSGVAGFIGYASGPVTANNSYSTMSIGKIPYTSTYSSSGFIGGLVASAASSVTLNNSFYYGSILHPCHKTTAVCIVGALVASGAASSTNSYGSIITPNWYNALPADNTSLSTIEAAAFRNSLTNGGKFKNVGALLPKLSWENDACSQLNNNASVANQAAMGRGVPSNPVILCNKEQWPDVGVNPTLHYSLGSNLALGTVSSLPTFAGALEGMDYLLSGFKVDVYTGDGGLFKENSGKIANVTFASGTITATGTSDRVGIVGKNLAGATIIKNKFEAINLTGLAKKHGVIAGENNGVITQAKVEGQIESSAEVIAMAVGLNNSTGTLSGVRANGALEVMSSGTNVSVGGLVGINYGVIQEVDSGVNISNTNNTSSGTHIGGLVGINEAIIKDALIRPYVSIFSNSSAVQLGHVLGKTTATSQVTRVVATNELSHSSGTTVRGKHFTAIDDSNAVYNNSLALSGAVYSYDIASPYTVSSCSSSAGVFTYTFSAAYNTDVTFSDGFIWIGSGGGYNGERISRRVTGAHSNGTDFLTSMDGVDFNVPCGSEGVETSDSFYGVLAAPNLSVSGVNSITPGSFSNLMTYCPSAQTGNQSYKCLSSEFDIVQDEFGGMGFERLKAAYIAIINKQPLPAGRPVWKLEDGSYPRLFLADQDD